MMKKTLLATGLVTLLSACNNDNNDYSFEVEKENYKEPRIIVVGHRGASALRPEHTLEKIGRAHV